MEEFEALEVDYQNLDIRNNWSQTIFPMQKLTIKSNLISGILNNINPIDQARDRYNLHLKWPIQV